MSSSSRTKGKMNNNTNHKKKNNDPKQNKEEVLEILSSSPSLEEEKPPKQEEVEEEVKSSNNSYQKVTEETTKKSNKKKKEKNEDGSSENGIVGSHSFAPSRISRIIRSEVADLRITQESMFLISKATEHFLEQFCEEVYANVAQERRKAVHYKHVSSVVSKSKRYDFLSDFVPEKIRVEDALSERLAGI